MMQQIALAHMPPELAVYATVFTNVDNAAFLKERLLAGDTAFEYALLDAATVISRKQVLAATFRALNDYLNDRLKSRNVHSEIVFALSPNNNIGEAFGRFGVQEHTKNIIVLKVATNPSITLDSVRAHLTSSIKGEERPFEDAVVQQCTDLARIRKIYKLNAGAASKRETTTNGDAQGGNGVEIARLERQILGFMALRGAT
ncbi:hypothetical protein DV737_g3608, partial [Chaetothyriales sp. CBS 132003]